VLVTTVVTTVVGIHVGDGLGWRSNVFEGAVDVDGCFGLGGSFYVEKTSSQAHNRRFWKQKSASQRSQAPLNGREKAVAESKSKK